MKILNFLVFACSRNVHQTLVAAVFGEKVAIEMHDVSADPPRVLDFSSRPIFTISDKMPIYHDLPCTTSLTICFAQFAL